MLKLGGAPPPAEEDAALDDGVHPVEDRVAPEEGGLGQLSGLGDGKDELAEDGGVEDAELLSSKNR